MLINRNPASFDEYVGNENIKEIIKITINACKEKHLHLAHILISGQRGTGKTTLATLIAKELKLSYKIVSGEAIASLNQLTGILVTNLPDIIIIDEIHRVKHELSDMLHQAMDDFKYTYMDEDDVMRTAHLKPFTIIGCTTDDGKLTIPLYSRFAKKFHLQLYSVSNLQRIIMNVAKNNNINIDSSAAYEIARRSNRVPRNAVLLFQSVYEYAIKHNKSIINHGIVRDCLNLHEIDEYGLSATQREVLRVLSFAKAPLGVENLAQRVGVGKEALVSLYEPYLLSIGFIIRTSSGRKITVLGNRHIASHDTP